jgi:predicted phage-related endonuclease
MPWILLSSQTWSKTVAEQRTEEWYRERAGVITGSRFVDVHAGKKARLAYAHELVFERLSSAPKHEIKSRSLNWGTEIEAFGKQAYEVASGNLVEEMPFTRHPDYHYIGCSPDGRAAADGGIELKCPMSEAVHVQTLLEGMPDEHMPQVQGEMMVTGWQWVDFISYDPRMVEPYRLFVQRIPRDQAYIDTMLRDLIAFEMEVRAIIERLAKRAA